MVEFLSINIIGITATAFGIVCMVLIKVIFQLKRQITCLNQIAQKDELTQAYTRRYFFEILEYHLKLIHRYDNLSAVLMLDIDNFKEINDSFGHPFGDGVLMQFVQECNQLLRESDILARYGGDEFILLCPLIDYDDLVMIAHRIQKALQSYEGVPISLSVGAYLFSHTSNLSHIIQYADEALYCAKKNGKNRVEFFTAS
jgi:diguanylate cyclase (GGDEF)-like protein